MRKRLSLLIFSCFLLLGLYALGRLYFRVTAGFTINNISSDFSFQPEWETRPLEEREKDELEKALNQSYHYLGKGCQSYAFLSDDGRYVIKFFKYQRYRLQPWLAYFPPLPSIHRYRKEKKEKKWKKLDGFIKSWKLAFDHLKEETALVFVHLNKTDWLHRDLLLTDKTGWKHRVSLDEMEFCIQKRADMLCDRLLQYQSRGELERAKSVVTKLLALILSEYARGFADNDHALMQNTGIVLDSPIHIDVGQFVFDERAKESAFFHQELYTKMYKFKGWLHNHYPELGDFLEKELAQIIGPAYETMQPKWRKK